MGRHSWTTSVALVGLLLGGILTIVLVTGDSGGSGTSSDGHDVVPASTSTNAAAYAYGVSQLCNDGIDVAEQAGYDDPAAGARAMHRLAADLAAVPPPLDPPTVAPMAQALVGGIDRYGDLFHELADDGDEETFSQDQNELIVVLEVRAAGLGANCGRQDESLSEASPPRRDSGGSGDAALEATAGRCYRGDLAACDELIADGGPYVYYGVTCGGRLTHEEANENIGCVSSFAGRHPVGDQPA